MPRLSPRLAGRLRRARIRVAHGAITLGGTLHGALAELGLWLEPKFGTGPDGYRAPRPWAGLAVLVILLCGVTLVLGGSGFAIVQALPPLRGAAVIASRRELAEVPVATVPLWLDLLRVRAHLAAEGEVSVFYARRHGIDLDAVAAVIGTPVLVALRYQPDRSFDLDGGTPSIVIEARSEDIGEVLDLVAWPLKRPEKFARLYGCAAVLGERAMFGPEAYRSDRPLRVHRTPLAWIQARCDGVVLLDTVRGGRMLLDVPGQILAQDDDHAVEIAAAMEASLRLERIVVPVNRVA